MAAAAHRDHLPLPSQQAAAAAVADHANNSGNVYIFDNNFSSAMFCTS